MQHFLIAVVTLPPLSRVKRYDHAIELFETLSQEAVTESEVDKWGSDLTADLYEHLVR